MVKIALSTDHAGYTQLQQLQEYLEELGHECINLGPKKLEPNDDYPPFILAAAKAVASGEADKGIIMGGSGQGEAMAANRVKGVRCAIFYGPAVARSVVDAGGRISHDPYEIVKLSRQHNDANVLSLAARFVSIEDMKQVTNLWLETEYEAEERHERRIKELDENL